MPFDLVVAGGMVVDGTGRPRLRADVAVKDGRIAAIAPGPLPGARRLDATGLVVAPGFVDVDSHADWAVLDADAARRLAPLLRQGVTTVVGGACGYSPAPAVPGREALLEAASRFLGVAPLGPGARSFGELLEAVSRSGLPLNVGFLVGLNTVRAQVVAACDAPARAEERAAMGTLVREALAAGALGLSANLGFVPGAFASQDELLGLLEPVAEADALFAAHARAYTRLSLAYPAWTPGAHNVRAVEELVELARRARVRLHVFHLALAGRRTFRTAGKVLAAIDHAAAGGVDVAFDATPYAVAVGPLQLVFPAAFVARFRDAAPSRLDRARLAVAAWLQRRLLGLGFADVRLRGAGDDALRSLEGRSFEEIGRVLGTSPVGAALLVAQIAGMGRASVLLGTMSADGGDEAALRAVLAHPRCAFGTNAVPGAPGGPQNPSATGAFPRVLGRCCRELGLFPLEEAVRRMTSWPAGRVGLVDTGRIAEGCWADLAIFDPESVADPADPERADARPAGIRAVLVSGQVVVRDGEVVPGVRPGRLLRRARRALAPTERRAG